MSILIVDDTAEVRNMLQMVLETAGYRDLILAESARDAFRHLGMGGAETPDAAIDLILMDVQMPEMDGLEACRRIKGVERLRDIPIIMVTALAETGFLDVAFSIGAADYVTKPLNRLELLARMRSALSLKQEMDRRRARERELEQALLQNKVLQGLLPICATCKKIRDAQGGWQPLEEFISTRSNAEFTHSICVDCARKMHPDWDTTP